MDPIGFGFENFDGIGQWRDKDGNFPIEPAGKLVSGESFTTPSELKSILLQSRRQEFLTCLTEKMLTYALGRGEWNITTNARWKKSSLNLKKITLNFKL